MLCYLWHFSISFDYFLCTFRRIAMSDFEALTAILAISSFAAGWAACDLYKHWKGK